jgi:fructose-bisphosphate aldolase class II
MLRDAQKRGYAVCAPNFHNYETAKACIEAAEELNAPILLDFGYRGQIPLEKLIQMMRPVEIMAGMSKVPVVLQQDHGRSFEFGVQCIRAGFTSIMADRSTLSYEENVAQVKELAKVAHACGVSIEGEIGHVGTGNNYAVDGSTNLTEPEEAIKFCEETGIDAVAIAIGTAHGKYSGTPHLDFDRLDKIRKLVDTPLVLHGGSSTGDDNLQRVSRSGITKINIATDLLVEGGEFAFAGEKPEAMNNFFKGYKSKLAHYIKLFGGAGKAEGWNAYPFIY